ncbi:TPR_REGION domain-containing protein [Durusdinium trenchii]|uniref:TPR_REGION domain-containing protein n=1 Tax=Durusdinium trenchii TaxID=1381693 RepID=A0ABP0KLA3_9DINO
MAEALLLSRADIFVRLVVSRMRGWGGSGFTSPSEDARSVARFERSQGDWAAALPPLRREGFVRCNYVVTSKCGTEHRTWGCRGLLRSPCGGLDLSASRVTRVLAFVVRMADVSWHGKFVTGRSCGDVIARLNQKIGCDGLTPIGGDATEEEEPMQWRDRCKQTIFGIMLFP